MRRARDGVVPGGDDAPGRFAHARVEQRPTTNGLAVLTITGAPVSIITATARTAGGVLPVHRGLERVAEPGLAAKLPKVKSSGRSATAVPVYFPNSTRIPAMVYSASPAPSSSGIPFRSASWCRISARRCTSYATTARIFSMVSAWS